MNMLFMFPIGFGPRSQLSNRLKYHSFSYRIIHSKTNVCGLSLLHKTPPTQGSSLECHSLISNQYQMWKMSTKRMRRPYVNSVPPLSSEMLRRNKDFTTTYIIDVNKLWRRKHDTLFMLCLT